MKKMTRPRFDVLLAMLFLAGCQVSGPLAQCEMRAPKPPSRMTLDLGSNVTLQLAWIPAGQFLMGSPTKEWTHTRKESPQHAVVISKPFYMGVYPVTQAQYEQVMGVNPARVKNPGNAVDKTCWHDAMEFCRSLSEKTGRAVSLPTEAQFEYAIRAGTTTMYYFGDTTNDMGEYGWNTGDGKAKNAPAVGLKKPNNFGLYDVFGSVNQWCLDWAGSDYPVHPGMINPQGLPRGVNHIQRGCAYYYGPQCGRSSWRIAHPPSMRASGFGFRVVVAAEPDAQPVRTATAVFGTPNFVATWDDPVWRRASTLADFVDYETGKSAQAPVQARILFDDRFLYVGVNVDTGGAQNLKDAKVRRDGDWYEAQVDAVEILIGRTHASEPKYRLSLTWNGAQEDKVFGDRPTYDGISWDVVTRKTERGWAGLARVPLAALRCGAPGDGDVWLMNFTHCGFLPRAEVSQASRQGCEEFNLKKFVRVTMRGNPKPAVGLVEMNRQARPAVDVPLNAKVGADGFVNVEYWEKVPDIKLHYLVGLAVEPEDATTAKLAADKENLYFRVVASECGMNELMVASKTNNAPDMWQDDAVELYLDPAGTGVPDLCQHLQINAAGVFSVFGNEPSGGRSWRPGLVVKTARDDGHWIVEGKLPFSTLPFTPEPGKTLRLNLTRTKPGKAQSFWEDSAWSPIFESESYQDLLVKQMGTVMFK